MKDAITIQSTDSLDVTLPIAGVGSRSYAFIIDWHIRLLLALTWFVGVLLLLNLAEVASIDNMLNWDIDAFMYIGVLPAGLIYSLYHPLLEMFLKQTPGKRYAKIRIVDQNGHTPGVSAMLVRNIFRLIDSLPMLYVLGLGVAIFNQKALRIGDIAARTVLVHTDRAVENAFVEITESVVITGLSLQDTELLQDIISRWKQLERSSRIALAEKFLMRLGIPYPAEERLKDMDSILYEKLQQLRNEGVNM